MTLLLGATYGCGGERAQAPPSARAPRVPSAAPAPPNAVPPVHDVGGVDTEAAVARALQQMAEIRELPALGKVSANVLARKDMVAQVEDQLHREVPAQVVRASGKMLFAFGVVASGFDLERSLLELMSAELAGFYEPEEKKMYLLRELGEPEREATLSHELVHALQDQHYDLAPRIAYRDDASDEQSATHALAEGDATSAMIDRMLLPRGLRAIDVGDEVVTVQTRASMEADPNAARVPGIIRRSVVSSYTDGLSFVHWARRRGGWAYVDEIWQKPPLTTEQLLHPQKYLSHELAVSIPIPVVQPGGPAQLVYRDIQGEQSVRLLLEEWVPATTAASAASGWDGDRVAVFSDGRRTAVAWHIRYDSAAAATRGFETFARGVLRDEEQAGTGAGTVGPEAGRAKARTGKVCRERAQRGAFAAVRHGADLAIVAGPFTEDAAGARGEAALRWAGAVARQR